MADDALALVLAGLEETPAVRPAFAESLRLALHRELGFIAAEATAPAVAEPAARVPAAEVARPTLAGRVRDALGSLRPLTPRAALLIALALVAIACSVAAVYYVASTWVSTGHRSLQYSDDFTVSEALRDPDAMYVYLRLSADGRSLIGIRNEVSDGDGWLEDGPVVRVGLADPASDREELFDLQRLREPQYWDPGTDLSVSGVALAPSGIPGNKLEISPSGDLFLAVATGMTFDAEGRIGGPLSSALVVVHPDGSAQKIVTVRELADAGLLGGHLGATGWSVTGVPSAPDRLWVRAELPVAEPAGSAFWLFQVTDPNADGDWSDRVVQPLALPDTVPAVPYGTYDWLYGPFTAEPSVAAGRDRSRSILLPMFGRGGEYRVYRVADPDWDGDATDPGEVELVFATEPGQTTAVDFAMTLMTPRVVMDGDRVVIDELLASSLTRQTRVSRLTATGVVDIVRALPWPPGALVAAPDGSILVGWSEATTGSPSEYRILRLTPVPVVASGSPGALPSVAANVGSPSTPPVESAPPATGTASPVPEETPLITRRPVTAGVARMAFWLMGDTQNETLVAGVDGSGPDTLIPGEHNSNFCQSADGTQVAYWSDEEAANEYFLYLANADGTGARRISDDATSFACPFPVGAFAIITGQGPTNGIVALDPETGAERPLVEGVTLLEVSSDGRRLALGTGEQPRDLQWLDVVTGELSSIGGPFEQTVRAAWWSPDGSRLVWVLGPPEFPEPPPDAEYEVMTGDTATGEARSLLRTRGLSPQVAWSADNRRVSIRTRVLPWDDPKTTGSVLVVDTATGTSREVSDERAMFAGWSPVDPDALAYATRDALYLVEGDATRKVADAPTGTVCTRCTDEAPGWPADEWLGWSPDGAWIGLGWFSTLSAVEVATGRLQVLYEADGTVVPNNVMWWR